MAKDKKKNSDAKKAKKVSIKIAVSPQLTPPTFTPSRIMKASTKPQL